MYWLRRRRKAGAAAAKKQARASRHAKRAHQREMRRLLLVCSVAIAEHLSDGKGKRERLTIVRAKNSWEGSTLFGYLYKQSADAIDVVYKDKFRMTSKTLHDLSALIEASGCSFVPKPGAVKGRKLKPVSFKLGACLYVLAKGDSTSAAADCASVGQSTVEAWLRQFVEVCCIVLKPVYMPDTPSPAMVQATRSEFAARRGIPNVGMACDGSHVPFRTHHTDYRNYKGWYSILVLGWVTSFYLFADADVGFPGRAGDNSVLPCSALLKKMLADIEAYLGEDGVVLGDSGASDGDEVFMNPYPNPKTPREFYFNFCHSSTRFFVEETFGRWKNRFRFLLHDHDMKHELHAQLIYCTIILHNVCTIHKDDAVAFDVGSDNEWQAFFKAYKRDACPSCTRANMAHCTHMARNRSRERKRASCPKGKPSQQRALLTDRLWDDLCSGKHDLMPASAHDASSGAHARAHTAMMHAMRERAAGGY